MALRGAVPHAASRRSAHHQVRRLDVARPWWQTITLLVLLLVLGLLLAQIASFSNLVGTPGPVVLIPAEHVSGSPRPAPVRSTSRGLLERAPLIVSWPASTPASGFVSEDATTAAASPAVALSRSAPATKPTTPPGLSCPAAGGPEVCGAQAATSGPTEAQWAALRRCESGGNYAIATGNGYFGAYQFDLATWQANGGPGRPDLAPPATQDRIARLLYARRGAQPWPVCGRYLKGLS